MAGVKFKTADWHGLAGFKCGCSGGVSAGVSAADNSRGEILTHCIVPRMCIQPAESFGAFG